MAIQTLVTFLIVKLILNPIYPWNHFLIAWERERDYNTEDFVKVNLYLLFTD